ncbi:MAG: hypothetical protein FWE61_05575 [Micrococcales bacterium]|nr:hypothetical protein [Micrococcales bacterium]
MSRNNEVGVRRRRRQQLGDPGAGLVEQGPPLVGGVLGERGLGNLHTSRTRQHVLDEVLGEDELVR